MGLKIGLIVGCVALMMLFICVRTIRGGVWGVATKALASVAFVSAGIIALGVNGGGLGGALIVIGLVFGLVGDILLDLKVVYPDNNDFYLNCGMLSFGLGHIAFAFGLSLISSPESNLLKCILISLAIAIVAATLIMLMGKPMKLNFGKFFFQSFGYAIALVFMSAYSIALSLNLKIMFIAAVGFVLFLLSDLVLSTQYFGGKQDSKPLIVINHTLYYLAQISIVAFLLFL